MRKIQDAISIRVIGPAGRYETHTLTGSASGPVIGPAGRYEIISPSPCTTSVFVIGPAGRYESVLRFTALDTTVIGPAGRYETYSNPETPDKNRYRPCGPL